ncbi:M20 family metallopeptidase [Martelella alba]|uniref:Peptidase M20 domain-containing protein 2 n=1 Tax=Martelella alba TaxID=2590451 RepID=A0ABY2SEY2_9HYPH|nr:M20 family metallopeptidase [Martelella alba]TKI02627.1 M20 family metallopeptidase [Martelella alba]
MIDLINLVGATLRDDLVTAAHYIHANPELGLEEKKAQATLVSLLRQYGFTVETGLAGLETSFVAEFSTGPGPVIAYLAEYDALPGIGHACGHNIIGTASVGAGIITKQVMERNGLGGTVKVFGTPAEEIGVGKIKMIEAGVFAGVDAAMLMHPSDIAMADDISFANATFEYHFTGSPAHAAAYPWEGRNALSGVIEMFNAVNALRLHVRDFGRINGIITEGGVASNIIPDSAKAVFNLRALESAALAKIIEKVHQCARGAALATDTEVAITRQGYGNKEIRNNKIIVGLVAKYFDAFGIDHIPRELTQGIGSTDMANVTHEFPAVQSYIGIGKAAGATHTLSFAEAAGSAQGDRAIMDAARVMAASGLEMMSDGALLARVKAEFDARGTAD